jgi:hypothetical protein
LQSAKAIIERQHEVLTKGDDERFFVDREHRRPRLLRSGLQVVCGLTLLPARDRLRIDAVAAREAADALRTFLYCPP